MAQADDELDEATPADRPEDTTEPCNVCGGPTVLCCSGCEDVFYCSVSCQQKDWATHRLACHKRSDLAAQQALTTSIVLAEPKEKPPSKQEIVLVGKEHAIKGAEEKREQLRAAAVAASRERRYMDVLDSAMQAYQMGAAETRRPTAGEPDVDLNQLVELLLLARATHVAGEHASGLKYLDHLSKMVDNLTGADGNLPIFHPCSAATLLLCTAELFTLFGQQERAADYSRAYIAMARLAHGEGSSAVGDAYGFHAAVLARRGSLEEALHHTMMMLQVRQRCGDEKPIADAHWNVAVLLRELHQYKSAIESLQAAREIYSRCSGEGLDTSQADIAMASVLQLIGEHAKAVQSLRQAVRARQRTFGFANLQTKQAAELLAEAEGKLNHENEKDCDSRSESEFRANRAPAAPVPMARRSSAGKRPSRG
ncbi:unnamed protein product [Effrenium voratum]|uniref:MYND-type domain-containing protein n=1 Tax=Effrenium voratum TaxID=2562239 RepID=A0AA36NLS1_9DINO|nr:unnamed protein product [Effrenium voratum]CAJ1409776.1 unnamed protein product [Effrenium voratum]CAJ1423187.1 unnamed protein product [Effrenium voratum]